MVVLFFTVQYVSRHPSSQQSEMAHARIASTKSQANLHAKTSHTGSMNAAHAHTIYNVICIAAGTRRARSVALCVAACLPPAVAATQALAAT